MRVAKSSQCRRSTLQPRLCCFLAAEVLYGCSASLSTLQVDMEG